MRLRLWLALLALAVGFGLAVVAVESLDDGTVRVTTEVEP